MGFAPGPKNRYKRFKTGIFAGGQMSAAWIINAVGLFATTTGVLLILLYLCRSPVRAEESAQASAEAQARQHRHLVTAVSLLAVWLVLQDLAVILL